MCWFSRLDRPSPLFPRLVQGVLVLVVFPLFVFCAPSPDLRLQREALPSLQLLTSRPDLIHLSVTVTTVTLTAATAQ